MLHGLTIECDNTKPDGTICGAVATVTKADYDYEGFDISGADNPTPKLLATQYEIECPVCGNRQQVETAASPPA